jgi:hypothetical protein
MFYKRIYSVLLTVMLASVVIIPDTEKLVYLTNETRYGTMRS